MTRKHYSKEFKFQAVMLVLKQQHPVAFVAKKLDIHKNSLYRWIQEYEQHGERAFQEKDIGILLHNLNWKQLEKENKRLKEELEILKKFQVFLKQNQK